jgi:TctA family transporter
MLDPLLQAIENFGHLEIWLFMGMGIIIGLIFGIIPGLGGIVALSLLLPFTFTMTPEQAFPIMLAILGTQFMGGSISAILLNIPGTVPNTATIIDGFPMTQRGEAGRALGAAMTASLVGSLITGVMALGMLSIVFPVVMALRSADMVFFILLGLTFLSVLATDSMLKGLISGAVGLLLACVGHQAVTGMDRFTFEILYLYEGIPLIPLSLGLFAVPEMIAVAARGGTLARAQAEISGMADVYRGVRDVFRHWWLVLRSTVVGFLIGIIPGVGGETATFVAYGQAKQYSKNSAAFGTGCVEGVIAPEGANDAMKAGSLMTTLVLGIPGSAPMALLLGGMILLGLQPGPEMVTKHLDLSLTMIWVLLISSIIGVSVALPSAPRLAKLAFIPGSILAPVILVIVFIGTFAAQQRVTDLIVFVIFSFLGLAMRQYGYSRPCLFLGFVLGSRFEKNLFVALKVDGPLFFMRPISLTLIAICITLIAYGPVMGWLRNRAVVR